MSLACACPSAESALVLVQLDLSGNELCGVDLGGRGTYTTEGIKAIADALGVSASLTQVLAFLPHFFRKLAPNQLIFCIWP